MSQETSKGEPCVRPLFRARRTERTQGSLLRLILACDALANVIKAGDGHAAVFVVFARGFARIEQTFALAVRVAVSSTR